MQKNGHPVISKVGVYLKDEIRIAQLGRRLKIRNNPKIIELLLDSFESNGGK